MVCRPQEQIFLAEYPHAAQQGQGKCFLFSTTNSNSAAPREQRKPVSLFLQDGVVE
jgi:hypothetical protein